MPVAIVCHFGLRTGLQMAHLIWASLISLCQLDYDVIKENRTIQVETTVRILMKSEKML